MNDRERYLEKLLVAMRTTIEDIIGIEIPFREKFYRMYDVDLQPPDESEIYKIIDDYNEAYKGSGSLNERMKFLKESRKISPNKAYTLFKEALNITKIRTVEVFGDFLPKKEKILLELVKKKREK